VWNELSPSQLTNCTIRKKCEDGADGENRLRITNFLEAPTRRRTKEKYCITFEMNTWKG